MRSSEIRELLHRSAADPRPGFTAQHIVTAIQSRERQLRRRRGFALAAVVAAAGVICVVILGRPATTSTAPPAEEATSAPTPSTPPATKLLTIDKPAQDASVSPQHFAVRGGLSSRAPDGTRVWLFVYAPRAHTYYQINGGPVTVSSTRTWQAAIIDLGSCGDETGQKFVVSVGAYSPRGSTELRRHVARDGSPPYEFQKAEVRAGRLFEVRRTVQLSERASCS